MIFFFVLPPSIQAATIYIDGNLGGNCTGDYSISNRSCSGSDGNAYNTISGGIGGASAGDTINIREGTYDVNSAINVSFSSTSTTTIQAYNSESVTIANSSVAGTTFNLTASAKNILFKDLHLTGTPYYVITGWSNYSGNVWTATIPYSTTQVRFNTTNGTNAGSIGAVDAANEYYISGTTIYAYSVGDPTTTYTSPGINLADNFNGGGIGNPSVSAAGNLITIDNVIFENFSHTGVKGSFKWYVKNSKFLNIGTDGNDHAIYDTGVQSSGNESVYEYNYFGYTPGYGLHFYTAPAYAIVRYNVFNGLSGSNRGSGAVLIGGNHTNVYNNTIYGWNNGLVLYKSGSQNNIVKNNIFSNNTNDLSIDYGGSSFPLNNTVEYNYFGSTSKCSGCTDQSGSGGQDYTTLDDEPANTYSSSPWTQFTYNFNKATTGSTKLSFFNVCGGGASPTTGTWYLDDISIVPQGGGSEQLSNGNFESTFTGGIASGWGAFGGATGTQETTTVHGGSNSQKLNITGGCGSRFETSVTLSAGDYTLTGWAKRETGTGTLVLYIAGGNTSATIGTIGPDFLGSTPYSEATDLKIDPSGRDASLLVNSATNLGTSHQTGLDSTSTSWPSATVSQDSYGDSWDFGAFVYASVPTTTDDVDTSWHSSDVTITLTCTESGGSGCATTYYTTDGSTPTTSSSSGNSFTLTSDGTYTIKYFSVDTLGNQESVKTASNRVKIDKTSPSSQTLVSPTGNTKDSVKPTLQFKKSSDSTSAISSYSVSLDSGKNRSFSISGIPASGNGTSNYVWKDDTSVKVVFVNENNSDSSDDEIHIYFKGLDTTELSEGKHTWTITAYDNASNSTSTSVDFYIDKTAPTISELAIADVSLVSSNASYNLHSTNRMPSFSGLATDVYQGSTVTNSNGTKDTFDKVSSGPKTITLMMKRLEGEEYKDYITKEFSLTDITNTSNDKKTTRFYVTTPFPLIDGKYKVQLVLKDDAGNTYEQPDFYLSLNSGQTNIIKTLLTGQNLETEIIKQETTPTETEEEKKEIQENGYDVKIKVVDKENNPVKGAKVTIHSKVQETTTNENGIAQFSNVEPGDHRVLIAYDNYKGEQEISLTGDVKEFSLTIQVEEASPFSTNLERLVVIILGAIILCLVFFVYKAKKLRG